jgi:hypothetical protein
MNPKGSAYEPVEDCPYDFMVISSGSSSAKIFPFFLNLIVESHNPFALVDHGNN